MGLLVHLAELPFLRNGFHFIRGLNPRNFDSGDHFILKKFAVNALSSSPSDPSQIIT